MELAFFPLPPLLAFRAPEFIWPYGYGFPLRVPPPPAFLVEIAAVAPVGGLTPTPPPPLFPACTESENAKAMMKIRTDNTRMNDALRFPKSCDVKRAAKGPLGFTTNRSVLAPGAAPGCTSGVYA